MFARLFSLRRPTRHSHRLVALIVALVTLVGSGCTALDEQQRRWVFQPARETWGGAAAVDGMQDRWIHFDSTVDAQPIQLHGLWLPQDDPKAPVALYLHGARWNVASSASRIRRLHSLGFSVLGIDYRGFGQSTDVLPSESGAYEDARAAWDWLVQQNPGVPHYVFGHSLGSAIAVQLVTDLRKPSAPDGLILEGAFTSIADVASTFKWGWLPFSFLVTQRFDAASRISKLQVPVLFVHGQQDRLIPYSLGQALYERAPSPKRFVLVEGGTHHNASGVGLDAYRAAVVDLFGLKNLNAPEQTAQN